MDENLFFSESSGKLCGCSTMDFGHHEFENPWFSGTNDGRLHRKLYTQQHSPELRTPRATQYVNNDNTSGYKLGPLDPIWVPKSLYTKIYKKSKT